MICPDAISFHRSAQEASVQRAEDEFAREQHDSADEQAGGDNVLLAPPN